MTPPTLEIKLDNARLELAEARSRLRAMQSASGFSGVFERYEGDIARLQAELQSVRAQNEVLARQAVAAELAGGADPSTPVLAPRKPTCCDAGSLQEGRFQGMRRQLKRLQLERDAAMEELGSFQRKERAFALAKKQLEQANSRILDLERRAAVREKHAYEQSLTTNDAHARAEALQRTVDALHAQLRSLLTAQHGQAEAVPLQPHKSQHHKLPARLRG